MFLLLALLLFIFLPSPWNAIGGLASGATARLDDAEASS
jgi:hypothetical protein